MRWRKAYHRYVAQPEETGNGRFSLMEYTMAFFVPRLRSEDLACPEDRLLKETVPLLPVLTLTEPALR